MYEIYAYPYGNPDAELLLYQPGNPQGTVLSPKLTREVSKGGSLTFTMTHDHPQYDMLQKMSTVVQVRQDNKEIWRGRILNHEADWYNNRAVYCEGALSYFNDSCVTPFNYEGTLKQFLQHLIEVHNEQVSQKMKQFELGTVTAALGDLVVHFGDADKYGVGEDYGKVWDIIDKMVLKVFGGYAYCTFNTKTGLNVLNYCDQAVEEKRMTAQKIEYGVNLLDLTEKTDTNDLYTRIYPLGNKHTVKESKWKYKFKWLPGGLGKYTDEHEERYGIMDTDAATIKKYLPAGFSYNLEEGWIQSDEAVKKFGVISRIVEHDTDSSNDTFAAGVQSLQKNHLMVTSYTIKAVDLVDAGEATDRLTFASYAHILSEPHSVDAIMLCSKLVEPLDHPEKKEYTFGMTRRTLTDRHVENMGQTNLLDESSAASEKYSENLLNQLFAYKKEVGSQLDDLSGSLTGAIDRMGDLQNQVDGNITSWFYEGVPTTSNAPAKDWTTDEQKKEHIGDLYYDTKNGLSYRWSIDATSKYGWTVIKDTSIAKALANAALAQASADSKVRCFGTTPTPPYDVGDIWMAGEKGDIKRCQTFKYAGEAFDPADWVLASKYTDDSYAKSVEQNLSEATKKINNIQSQVDGKVEMWYYKGKPELSNAPASSWKDDATKKLHIGDLYYDLSTGRCYHWTQNGSSYLWELVRDADIQGALDAAKDAQATADGKITSFTTQPTPPYEKGDIWMQGSSGDLYVCQTTRKKGESYNAADWVKATKYTDDTVANQAKQDAAEAAKTATNFIAFTEKDGMTVGHSSLKDKKVQITNDGVKVIDGSSMVVIKADGISITDGQGSCSINSGEITFHGIKKNKVLWENPNPKENFGEQRVTSDLLKTVGDDYAYLRVEVIDNVFTLWSQNGVPEAHIVPVNVGYKQRLTYGWDTAHIRFVQVDSDSVYFWDGASVENVSTVPLVTKYEHTKDNSVCIPVRIIGFM